jgi:hypothetical protein
VWHCAKIQHYYYYNYSINQNVVDETMHNWKCHSEKPGKILTISEHTKTINQTNYLRKNTDDKISTDACTQLMLRKENAKQLII